MDKLKIPILALIVGLAALSPVAAQECGDGVVDEGEYCDDGQDHPEGACIEDVPCESFCGNGVLETGEECDKGTANTDTQPNACRTDCRAAYCGDGIQDDGEECDEHSSWRFDKPNYCRSDCTLPICGDGITDDGSRNGVVFNEECDDGNNDDSDGCTAECKSCVQPQQTNLEISTDTLICSGTHELDDYGDYGALIIKASGITLDCHGATLVGDGFGVGIVTYRSNDIIIKNCGVRGYETGIRLEDSRNISFHNNNICGNSLRGVDLVNTESVNGYIPSMTSPVVCTDEIAQQQASVPRTAAKHPTAPPKSRAVPREKKAPSKSSARTKPKTQQLNPRGPRQAKAEAHSLYLDAPKATWTTRAGKVSFGKSDAPETGVVKIMSRGNLASGRTVNKLLYTQPQDTDKGYIQGEYRAVTLGSEPHLKTTVAMLKGAGSGDSLSFDVLVIDGKQTTLVRKQRCTGSDQVSLDVDLSRWSGKQVNLVLRARRLGATGQIPAVWVNPVLVSR